MENKVIRSAAIIPVHNEEDQIAKVILRVKPHVDKVIVCDDGSTDMTADIAKALGALVVSHDRKRGKGEAIKTLYDEVIRLDPNIIVMLDGDGQHDPDQIPMLTKPIEAGVSDVVLGSRYIDGGAMDAPPYRRVGLNIINWLYRVAIGTRVRDTQCGFRVYSRKAFKCLNGFEARGYGIEGEQLLLANENGLRITEVPIFVRYNGLSKTSKNSAIMQGMDLMFTLIRLVTKKNKAHHSF